MAVTEDFRESWLECQEEYGKNIEAGDIPVIPIDRMDMAVTLPAVKFTAPYDPAGENRFDSYGHVPMQTFKTFLDNLQAAADAAITELGQLEEHMDQAIDGVEELKVQTAAARDGANQAATAADTSRAAIEANEATRQQNESTRQSQEAARQQQASSDHQNAVQDHQTASSDHQTAGTDHQQYTQDTATAGQDHQQYTQDTAQASQDHQTAVQDHDASVAATTAATNVNADLSGMTVTITNRQGVSKQVNIGFEILEDHVYASVNAMNADAANVRAGQFCMIATTDPTSPDNAQLWSRNSSAATSEHPFTFLSDLDQASSAAFADWLDNYKPVIEADHATAVLDHQTATADHATSTTDHTTALADTATAGQDHQTAVSDHQTASQDTAQASQDHTRAEDDHQTVTTQGAYAETQGDRCRTMADHPDEIRSDGYVWRWDPDHAGAGADGYYRTDRRAVANVDIDSLTQQQRDDLLDDLADRLVFASAQTCEDAVTELL